jgi:deoxyribonuclease-2
MLRAVSRPIPCPVENFEGRFEVKALDEKGNPVDWWFIYKVPKLVRSAQSESATGYEYVYFDAGSSEVTRSPFRLDQGKGALNETLDAAFKAPAATTGWVLYNDEKPEEAEGSDDGNCGHTKGVLAYDVKTETALWLLHSWPKYVAPQETAAPTPMYGQTYLCLSLKLSTAVQIAEQMKLDHEPQVFLPRASKPANPAFDALAVDKHTPQQSNASNKEYRTAGGMTFRVLAKNRECNGDFWNGWVGPQLKENMDVETWIRGPVPPVADTDGIHKTFDVKFINLGPLGIHFAWPETRDHAKWGITKDGDWVCVGDINRMISQRKRGGGTIAFQSPKLWRALSKTDLLLAPPGHTRDEARDLIKSTHHDPNAPAAKERKHKQP